MVRWRTKIDRNCGIEGRSLAHRRVSYNPCVTWQNQTHMIFNVCSVCSVCNIYVSAAQSGIHARWSDSKNPGVNSARYNLIIIIRVARIFQLSSCAALYLSKLWLKPSISPNLTQRCQLLPWRNPCPSGTDRSVSDAS